ncbi:putative outer membrane starch-binding protein [Leeuwenhoekiella aestuarii]|uniref:Putative outer membrane starch-binding protein n=1 Tax=Leeuwenhoekiella aestuarii TaxID=2249426 RepID=A0A4Q0NPT0_9FLAO|nr:RagB/SusD family nutrient uptake outer membrane protein [Leeuwenhoekiella aestuarii]RXG11550.1 putative outer membrane starch-binding protein [Leeuwenhoekiella aestuarii]RXG12067.1 putative outer membrane starch-binding protein [Leeuwenhoekiella aestuarii]
MKVNISKFKIHFLNIILASFIISCNDEVLDEIPLDFVSSNNAYEDTGDAETGVIGLYGLAQEWYTDVDEQYMFIYVALGTDEAYFGENPSGGTMSNWGIDITPSSSLPNRYWDKAFDLVYQANLVIRGVESLEFTDETDKNEYLAEAHFFRAFAYRILVYMFGDVPLVTEPIESPKTDFVRAPKSSILDLITEDLNYAASNLPTRGNEPAPGRLTQGAAWHLLADVYLALDDNESAAAAASHVINDYGYKLMTERFGNQYNIFEDENVITDLFALNNQNLSSNTEAIWVIQNDPNVTGGGIYSGERAFGPAYYNLKTPDNFNGYEGYYEGSKIVYNDTLGRPVGWVRPTNYVAYDIWKDDFDTDLRNAESNVKRHFYYTNSNSAYNGKEIVLENPKMIDTTRLLYPYFMKVATPTQHFTQGNRSGGGYNHKDLYAMRLAETYLLRAEAYLKLNELGKAAADINLVRSRANASLVNAGDVNIDLILDERARELYTEEWRMLTLMRMNNLVERVLKYNDNPGNPGLGIQDYNRYFPIPQSEIDLNTGAPLEQNPGYTN